jgi:hypothetical protein
VDDSGIGHAYHPPVMGEGNWSAGRRVPPLAHFVFGLRPQREPFHVLHYVAIESCRRVMAPEEILFHCAELPWGAYWDAIRPHVTLVRIEPVRAVDEARYDPRLVPPELRYAHHADFVRLDALWEHGGLYADIDTVFVHPMPDHYLDAPFVIGDEGDVVDELTGVRRRSLCNAVMLAEPHSPFVGAWRAQMAGEINGTWSNHSGFLAARLAAEHPEQVVVAPSQRFFPAPCSVEGLADLLERDAIDDRDATSVHLWAHLWWPADRTDYSRVHAGTVTADRLRRDDSSLARLARPFLPPLDLG